MAVTDLAAGKLVVVIDDDALALDGMRGLLQSWGYAVVAADQGPAPLERLTALGRKPGLIISDYRLAEGETGIDAIDRLRGRRRETDRRRPVRRSSRRRPSASRRW